MISKGSVCLLLVVTVYDVVWSFLSCIQVRTSRRAVCSAWWLFVDDRQQRWCCCHRNHSTTNSCYFCSRVYAWSLFCFHFLPSIPCYLRFTRTAHGVSTTWLADGCLDFGGTHALLRALRSSRACCDDYASNVLATPPPPTPLSGGTLHQGRVRSACGYRHVGLGSQADVFARYGCVFLYHPLCAFFFFN